MDWEEVRREVRLISETPEVLGLEQHLQALKGQIENLAEAIAMSRDRRLIPALTKAMEEREAEKRQAETRLAELTAHAQHVGGSSHFAKVLGHGKAFSAVGCLARDAKKNGKEQAGDFPRNASAWLTTPAPSAA